MRSSKTKAVSQVSTSAMTGGESEQSRRPVGTARAATKCKALGCTRKTKNLHEFCFQHSDMRNEINDVPIIGWIVFSKNVDTAALYSLSETKEAYAAAKRWNASISALQLHKDSPALDNFLCAIKKGAYIAKSLEQWGEQLTEKQFDDAMQRIKEKHKLWKQIGDIEVMNEGYRLGRVSK